MYGKPMRKIYPHATRWQVIKYKAAKLFRQIAMVVMVSVGLAGGFLVLRYFFPTIIYKTESKDVVVDTLKWKVDELKSGVLADLKQCESGGAKESAGIVKFDSNGVASIGSFQFQVKTVQHYYKTLYQQDITGKDAVIIALDEARAESLAKDIIFSDANGIRNWLNCANKLGLRSRVNTIALLEK